MTIKVNAKTITLAAITLLVIVGYFISPLYIGTYLLNFLHVYVLHLSIIGAGIVGSLAWARVSYGLDKARIDADNSGRGYRTNYDEPRSSWLAVIPVIVGLLAAFGFGFYGDYAADKAMLAKSTVVTDDNVPSFDSRTAWEVARNRVSSDKGDLIGDAKSPRYLPEEQVFTSLVESPKLTGGYVGVIEQTIAADGATSARTCEVPGDSARLGGWFGGKLERQIAKEERGLRISTGDAYGYCDGEGDDAEAVVVVPLKKLTGFYPVIEEPAGAAIITGGDIDIVKDLESNDVPGPVYPTSLAASQRESLAAYESSFWQWLRGKAGFEEATNDGDPNSENPTEFSLAGADGELYVSPMTTRPKQDQSRITAYGVVDSGYTTAGSYNELVLHVVPKDERRESNGVVVDNLKSFYSEADMGWAQGLKVFEMVPTSSDEWVASLGFEKSVKYRVRLAADGSSCLEDADGNQLRCVDATGSPVGGDTDSEDGESSSSVPAGELTSLSNKELAELQEAVTSEMLRRLEAASTPAE